MPSKKDNDRYEGVERRVQWVGFALVAAMLVLCVQFWRLQVVSLGEFAKLAEDNRVNQMVAVAVLKKLGYQVDIAANGLEALAALRARPYDLVLMDCQMPEMDGFEATAAVRASAPAELNTQVPIVALTAHAMKGDRERCLAAGMDDYLAKPLQIDEVKAVLRRWLGEPAVG